MLALTSLIKIIDPAGKNYLEFDFVNEVEIVKSRKTLTNTCKITIARKIKILNGDINTVLRRGAKVEVKLGYDGNLRTEFSGYVARVGAKIPLVIECEDEMWNLKQNSFTKSWKKVKVKEIIDYVYKGSSQVIDLEIGGFVAKQESTAQVLDRLKKFGLQCYFDAGILVVDFAGSKKAQGKSIIYDFQKNVIDNDLVYTRKEDLRVKVRGISKLHTGKKFEIISGDPDGDEHTLHYVNLDKTELQKIVAAEIDKLKVDGYKNGFTAFGLPNIEPGDRAVMMDPQYPEHDGSYLTESVKTTFGVGGFRRFPELERRLA